MCIADIKAAIQHFLKLIFLSTILHLLVRVSFSRTKSTDRLTLGLRLFFDVQIYEKKLVIPNDKRVGADSASSRS